MKPGTKLLILITIAVCFWGAVIAFLYFANDPKGRAKALATEALQHTVENPESLRIIAISKPDSVFGRQYITSDEQLNITMAMMKVGETLMDRTENLEKIDFTDSDMSELMERQMSCMSAIRGLVGSDNLSETKKQPFSGWKIKIEYEATSRKGSPYRSEYWFILDKEAKCVIKSFEIPLI